MYVCECILLVGNCASVVFVELFICSGLFNGLIDLLHLFSIERLNICSSHNYLYQLTMSNTTTVWPEILAGNLFWQIGGFESNPPTFHPPKTSQCDVIIIAKS